MNPTLTRNLDWIARPIPLAVGLALLTFWLYSPALSHEFLNYDDGMYVYGNDAVKPGLSLGGVQYAFQSIRGGSWMPLTWLSHMLDVSVFGLRPAGHHLTNILLHALNSGLLLLVLTRASRQLWPAVFVAALFAFHPLRNESVAWIAERKDVLCALFWMLGMLFYVWYVEKPSRGRFSLVAIALACALMAKPMAVTFPFALLLLDFWPLNRLGDNWGEFRLKLPALLKEKALLFVIVAIMAVATFWSQREVGAMNHHTFETSERVMGAAQNYVFYLHKCVWPVDLTILYPDRKPDALVAVFCAVGLLVASALVVRTAFMLPWLAVGWFWFLGTAVPVIGLVRVGHIAVADRYSYLPSVGLAVVVVWTIALLVHKSFVARRIAIATGVAFLGLLAALTRADLPRWENSMVMFEAVNRIAPHAIAYNSIAVYHLDRGDFASAIEPASRAIQLNSRYENAYVNRAIAREKTGDIEGAKLDLARVDGSEPRSVEGYYSRAATHLSQGRYDEAIRDYTFAMEFAPTNAISFNNRANAHLLKRDIDAAIRDCIRAIELQPDYANAFLNLGNCYNARKDYPAALTHYTKAISIVPTDPLPYNNRAAVYFQLGQYDTARADLHQCRQLGGTPHAGLVEALTRAEVNNQ